MSSREPPPRWVHAAFGVGLKHYLWGGDGGSAEIQTTKIDIFDVSSTKWEEPQQLQGALPESLYNMGVTVDGENAYIFGGWNGSARINIVYEINLCTLQCRELLPASRQVPKGAIGSRIVCFGDKILVYGGLTVQGATDDLYVFDLKKSECGYSKFYSCLARCTR